MRQLRQMAIGGLPPALDPMEKPGDVVVAGKELEGRRSRSLEPRQQHLRLSHREPILRRLRQNANEPQRRDRACPARWSVAEPPRPALRTGRTVTASHTIAALADRACRGVRTICPIFTPASRKSPARSPSFRRIGPGRTTCPLLEMRVCIVRNLAVPGRRSGLRAHHTLPAE
jgi:hypothetical protein